MEAVMIEFSRRQLPHYDIKGCTYFVTACLAGSIPAVGMHAIRRQAETVRRRPRPAATSTASWRSQLDWEAFQAGEDWLDSRSVVRWLRDRRLAAVLKAEILREQGVRYDVHAYVIMPSHMHLVFTPLVYKPLVCTPLSEMSGQRPREDDAIGGTRSPRVAIMRSIKGRSAVACNRLLGREGPFWQSESYDRVVRNEEEMEKVVHYVEMNPVKAGLCSSSEEWPFSSAHRA